MKTSEILINELNESLKSINSIHLKEISINTSEYIEEDDNTSDEDEQFQVF